MSAPERFREYVDLVCRQIRWKKARPVVGRELETHLLDQRGALLRDGVAEADADR